MLDKLKFALSTILVTTCAYAALATYGQYQGYLDIRVYSTSEQAYNAQIHRAEALLARDAIPHVEYVPAEQEHEYAQVSAFDAVDHPRRHGR